MTETIAVACRTCGARYQMSPEREDCPCCGRDGQQNEPTPPLVDDDQAEDRDWREHR